MQLQKLDLIADDKSELQASYIWSLMHGLASLIIDKKLYTEIDIEELMTFIDHSIAKSLI